MVKLLSFWRPDKILIKENKKMTNEKVLCFFHANCIDGAAAAAIIKRKYPQAKCYPMNHGDRLRAKVKGKNLFIVDFSFSAEMLNRFKESAQSVHWYDHHITAVPTFKKIGWGEIDLKESGASLTWKKEFPDEPMPRIIEFIRDKDLYEWKLPHSREISMHLRGIEGITNPTHPIWKKLFEELQEKDWEKMIADGESALRHQKNTILQGLKNAFAVDFHGHRTLAVNWSLEASDMGEYIYKELGYPVALMFYFTGNTWNFSLRSEKIDVSALAQKHGGGGHPGAAGFRMDNIDWLLKMKGDEKEKSPKK
jgi:oligoribonuclease NrnB/cAMP/cGMP phosphodiesterase (DHH superfamily)